MSFRILFVFWDHVGVIITNIVAAPRLEEELKPEE